jgi:hypothetical protein
MNMRGRGDEMRNHLPYDANLARIAEMRARAEASRRARTDPPANRDPRSHVPVTACIAIRRLRSLLRAA